MAVNLDPGTPHYCTVVVPPEAVGVAAGETYGVTDLLTGSSWTWGERNYVRLDPARRAGPHPAGYQTRMKNGNNNGLPDDPLWYKDAIFYELRVRSFYDSNGDGVGDFPGLTRKLDYLRDLGVTTIWLLPFYPSPMRDDGYDISDYTGVHPECGTLHDFKAFLRAAHERGLRV